MTNTLADLLMFAAFGVLMAVLAVIVRIIELRHDIKEERKRRESQ